VRKGKEKRDAGGRKIQKYCLLLDVRIEVALRKDRGAGREVLGGG
jgi:hypothetical protein